MITDSPAMLISVVTTFLQGLGIVGLVTFAHEASLHLFGSGRARVAAVSVVFALGVVATMALPFSLGQGLRFDLRNAFLVLAPIFGGLPAALLTAVTAAIYRFHLGGVGAVAGVIGIVIATTVGIGASRYPRLFENLWRDTGLLSLAACLSFFSLFALPDGMAASVVENIGVPYVIANFVGVAVATMILRRRADAIRREAMLTQQADTDPLTDLHNERAFARIVPSLLERAAEHAMPCVLLFIHLEGVRTVNEHLGRNARDAVLRKAARVIALTVPKGHLVARVGAKEFSVLLLGRDQAQAEIIAENIRVAIAAEDFDLGVGSARIVVSIGLTLVRAQDRFDDVLARVDAALQAAKRNGRNRVEVAKAA